MNFKNFFQSYGMVLIGVYVIISTLIQSAGLMPRTMPIKLTDIYSCGFGIACVLAGYAEVFDD